MMLESLGASFAYVSLICSLSFWLSLVLNYFARAATTSLSGNRWLAIQGTGILFAAIAAVLNFEKRVWVFAIGLALVTFLFVI
jgi:hypothetical protein